jgi:hypothetical protein
MIGHLIIETEAATRRGHDERHFSWQPSICAAL